MAINKIKLKQIDADFPTLVGQYGSGYFSSTGSLHSLSGQSVKYSDLATGAFIYTTGSQNISGYKNFMSRPAISGVGIATLGEIVSIDGDNAIFGDNTFTGSNIFLNSTKFQNNNVQFDNSSFTFVDSTSLDNLTNSLTKFVKTTGNQIVDGVKTFRSGIKVGGAGGSGVLYSGQINPVYVSGITGNSNRYLTFVENTGNGFKNMQMHTGFSYTASTQTLNSKIFSGNLSGDALRAISSSGVYTSGSQNLNAQMYPSFATANSNGFQVLSVNSGLLYNPGINALTAQTFSGNLSGSALVAISSSGVYTSGSQSLNQEMYPAFAAANASNFQILSVDGSLSYNPSTNILTTSIFKGGFSGSALDAAHGTSLNIGVSSTSHSVVFNFPTNTPGYIMASGSFEPAGTTATRNLGSSSVRWKEVFASVGTINTSDKNLKTEISEIPDSWLDAWQEVNYVRYKFKDSVAQKGLSGARWHLGHIAQDIYEKFNSNNLNAFDIGMLCYDKWDESVDQNGNLTPSGEIWSIRPDECQFMEMALMRRSINRLKSGILI
jgi:hypothetical protein